MVATLSPGRGRSRVLAPLHIRLGRIEHALQALKPSCRIIGFVMAGRQRHAYFPKGCCC
jgi:hypothetical protein